MTCHTKKNGVIVSFLIVIIPVVICLLPIIACKMYNTIEWSKKKSDLEKSNEILYRLYDENIDMIKENYIAVEIEENCVILKQYNDIFNDYLDKNDLIEIIKININDEERDMLKKATQYDDVIIVEGNEIVYKKRLKNKNPVYCDKMYKIKHNRMQEYQDEYDRSFMDNDRKWCVEDPYIGENGTVPWFTWGLNLDKYGIYK